MPRAFVRFFFQRRLIASKLKMGANLLRTARCIRSPRLSQVGVIGDGTAGRAIAKLTDELLKFANNRRAVAPVAHRFLICHPLLMVVAVAQEAHWMEVSLQRVRGVSRLLFNLWQCSP